MSTASPVELGSLTCPACGTVLEPHGVNHAQEALCGRCRTVWRGLVFPAVTAPPPISGERSERALDGEAVCYFHPSNRAVLTCDSCGRFLCTICDMPVGSRHLCATCLSKSLGRQQIQELIPWRFLWARATFWLGLVPLLVAIVCWPALLVTGGATVILGLVGWKRSGSLVRGPQTWLMVLGILLGLLQIAIWFGLIILIIYAGKKSQ
jgi:hypothetical protein